MSVKSFKDLTVWQKSLNLVKIVYEATRSLPQEERFGLASQLQRAAVSIPSNIAEGSKRSSRADFRQFCLIALGSAAETETQLLLVAELYPAINATTALELVTEVQKMLTSLERRLSQKL